MNRKIIYLAAALFFTLTVGVYGFEMRWENLEPLRSAVYTLAPVLPFVLGLLAVRAYGRKSAHGKAFLLLTAGIGCWMAGEILWSIFDFVLQIDPFPSVADVFYVAAYPLFFAGLVKEFGTSNVDWLRLHKGVLFSLLFSAVPLALVVAYFGVYMAYSPEAPWLESLVSISYGVGDLILILVAEAVLVLAWEFRGGKMSVPWVYFFFALMATLAADIIFASFNDLYTEKTWPYFQVADALWIGGYLIFALSFFEFYDLVRGAQEKVLKQLRE